MPFFINEFHIENLPALLRIEQASYPNPWKGEQFLQELEHEYSWIRLLWQDDELAGYICFWLVAGEMQILNLATAPEFRRQRVAGRLLQHALDTCQQQKMQRCYLEVRRGNTAAISLYQHFGFVIDGQRLSYYSDGEDALLMVLECNA